MKPILPREFSLPQIERPFDERGLVFWYSALKENQRLSNAKVWDLSGNDKHGTIEGASWVGDNMIKYPTLNFDGSDDRVNLGDISSLKPTTAITISAWFKANNVTGNYGIVSCFATGYWGYDLWIQNGIFQWYLAISGTSNDMSIIGADVGVWRMITTSWDGTTNRMYLDGVEKQSLLKSGTINYNTTPITVGYDPFLLSYFNGLIDDVRIYNRALTSQEIMQRYENTKHFYGM